MLQLTWRYDLRFTWMTWPYLSAEGDSLDPAPYRFCFLAAQSADSDQGSYSVQVARVRSCRGTFSFHIKTDLHRGVSIHVKAPYLSLQVQLMTADESEPPVQQGNVSYDIPPLTCLGLLKEIGDSTRTGLIYVPPKSQLWLICTSVLRFKPSAVDCLNRALYFERRYSSQILNWYVLCSIWIQYGAIFWLITIIIFFKSPTFTCHGWKSTGVSNIVQDSGSIQVLIRLESVTQSQNIRAQHL